MKHVLFALRGSYDNFPVSKYESINEESAKQRQPDHAPNQSKVRAAVQEN